jgi:DNA topoisomerase IA
MSAICPRASWASTWDEDFAPTYEVIASRKKVLKELKDEAKKATTIFMATDPDREGEAIGWHLAEELGATNKKKIRRLMFNEITKKGVLAALDKPMDIDKNMVERAAGAPRPRPARRLQDQSAALGQGPPRT